MVSKEEEKRGRRHSRGLELIASLRKKQEGANKEVLMFNRLREESRELRTRRTGEAIRSRLVLTRDDFSPEGVHLSRNRRFNF